MTSLCPFVKTSRRDDSLGKKTSEKNSDDKSEHDSSGAPKCPFGYDYQTFKLGPFSCMICQALLFDCCKCVPCGHVFCKICISKFKDCPLCGADIEKTEADLNLQSVVDRFIEGHARIKRSQPGTDREDADHDKQTLIYEDTSLERGSFLMQQAMRALRAGNVESAKSRLSICAEDVREQLQRMGNTPELCSQLGVVLGMLGDCCRSTGDTVSAILYFQESADFLRQVPGGDLEISHALSVSLNKIGDLKYYEGDLDAARCYYSQALNVRQDVIKKHDSTIPSQVIDVAISLAKVADIDRNLGNEGAAVTSFREGIKILDSLVLNNDEPSLQQRRLSVLEFLRTQLGKN